MDDDLSDRARQLIAHAMDADVPPAVVADGSWEIVVSRLTIEAARETEASVPASRPTVRGWIGVAALAVALGVAAALLWFLLQPRTPVPPPPPVVPPAPVSSPPVATPTPATPPSPEAPAAPVDAAKLLDDAEAAEPARALELLARHAELVPLGADTERRMALRIAALCALGRTDDARADARAFLGQPRDPKWIERVRATCAGP